jgi:RNA polymerase sigma factor (sigma-70 family)
MEMMMTDEYRFQIKIRNNVVLKRIEELGFDSIPEFCRAKKLGYNLVTEIINFKRPFYTKQGAITLHISKLADALSLLPDHIYPPERRSRPLASNTYNIEANKNDLMQIAGSLRMDALPPDDRKMLDDFQPTLSQIMDECLSPRYRDVLERRFGLLTGREETLYEIASDMGVTPDRIRQLEAVAIRKLKHPDRSKRLREYNDFFNDLKSR